MERIIDYSTVLKLINNYQRKESISNIYFFQDYFELLIKSKKLFFINTINSLLFFEKKENNFQIYFITNDIEDKFYISEKYVFSVELPYRNNIETISKAILFLSNNGFENYLIRKLLFYKAEDENSNSVSKSIMSNYVLDTSHSEMQIRQIKEILESSFDKYTGDILSKSDLIHYNKNGWILSAKFNQHIVGFIQFVIKKNQAWVGHIAVDERYRGKAIAQELMLEYIKINKSFGINNFYLWVIHDNFAAISVYSKIGFLETGKLSLSMLKK